MGILDEILGGAIGGQGIGRPGPASGRAAGGNSALLALLPIVVAMLANRRQGPAGPSGGGLSDVLGQMLGTGGAQRGGDLGDVLGQVLSERNTSTGLAQLLPEVIDHVSPQGRIPDDDQLASTLQDLVRRLG